MHCYEIWDLVTRNLVEDFENEAAASDDLRGMANLDTLALARRDARGHTEWLGRGAELQRFIREHTPA